MTDERRSGRRAMTDERRARLQGLPGWGWRAPLPRAIWEAQYLALQAFLRENDGRYPTSNAAQPIERSLYHVRPPPLVSSLCWALGIWGGC